MKKNVTCNFEIAYSEGQLDTSDCSVSCSLSGGLKKRKIDERYTFNFTVGDTPRDVLIVKVGFKLYKAKNQAYSKMETKAKTYTASSMDAGEASYPSDLWCPQEDTLIYTASNTVVNEVKVD